jgi:hypothetical protein
MKNNFFRRYKNSIDTRCLNIIYNSFKDIKTYEDKFYITDAVLFSRIQAAVYRSNNLFFIDF